MDIQNNGFLSIEQLTDRILGGRTTKEVQTTEGLTFKEILDNKTNARESLKFSKHAAFRLSDRGIELSDDQLTRLENGADKARRKGIKDSLVIVDDLAFIVNVPNSTVVTAIDSAQADENVFTNINGAVIM